MKAITLSKRKEQNLARVLLLIVAAIWGFSYVVVKDGLDAVPPGLMHAWRNTVAFVLLTPFLASRLKGLRRDAVFRGLLIGIINCSATLIQNTGLKYTTASNGSFLISGYVILVPFFAWFVTKKRPSGWDALAAVVCMAGIGLISLDGALHISKGDSITLLSCVCFALQLALVGTICKNDDPLTLTWLLTTVSVAESWIYTLAVEGKSGAVAFEGWKAILFMALFVTIASYIMQNWSQTRIPPAEAVIIMALEAVFGAAAGTLLQGDPVTLKLMSGFAVVFAAVLMSGLHAQRAEKSEAPTEKDK